MTVHRTFIARIAAAAVPAALVAGLLAGSGGGQATADEFTPPTHLTLSMEDDYAPYSFRPENGAVQGIMRDLWDLWSSKTGVALTFIPVGRDRRLQMLDEGTADVSGFVVGTEERLEKYLLAPAPAEQIQVVIFFDRDITGIGSVQSLEGFTVGVMDRGTCAEWLAKQGVPRLRNYASWDALYTAAARGEVNVFCSGKATGMRRLYQMKLQKEFHASLPLYTTPVSWAVRKDDAALRDFIAAGFARITPEERQAIEQRWTGQPLASLLDDKVLRFLAWALLLGALAGAALFAWNASLRRQVAAKTRGLAQSEQRYRALVEAVPVGIYETDAQGGNVYVNDLWTELTGFTREQTRGEGWIGAVHPEDRAALIAGWREAVTARARFRHEFRLCRIDGSLAWVMVEAVPRFDADGIFSGYLGSISDLTERRRHEEELQRLERQSQESKKLEALGQFAGGIAHDFNNFLGAILGYAQFIVEDAADQQQGAEQPSAARYAQRILTAGRRGRALVEQILTFTRRTRMTRRRFHLSELLGEIEELMFASAAGTVEFHCHNGDPDAVVEADRDQLGQVLLNLCINAQDALGGRAGSVTVRVRRTALPAEVLAAFARDDRAADTVTVWDETDGTAFAIAGAFDPALPHVSLVVGDTGLGMDAALLEQAFTPFFTTKEKGHGTGLGLAVVRGIVLAHGAALIARSREGAGTSIEIAFPRVAVEVVRGAAAAAAAAAVASRGKRRILLVDDDADFCDMMHLLLERLGFEVVPYVRPREALNDFRELPATWDVLITDQHMHELTGLELVAAVRAIRPDFPCLICSAFSASLTDAALREAGAYALIRKPVDKDLLLATLERALSGRERAAAPATPTGNPAGKPVAE